MRKLLAAIIDVVLGPYFEDVVKPWAQEVRAEQLKAFHAATFWSYLAVAWRDFNALALALTDEKSFGDKQWESRVGNLVKSFRETMFPFLNPIPWEYLEGIHRDANEVSLRINKILQKLQGLIDLRTRVGMLQLVDQIGVNLNLLTELGKSLGDTSGQDEETKQAIEELREMARSLAKQLEVDDSAKG